jgi:hypothetical protein
LLGVARGVCLLMADGLLHLIGQLRCHCCVLSERVMFVVGDALVL